jgi:hypothetical protein
MLFPTGTEKNDNLAFWNNDGMTGMCHSPKNQILTPEKFEPQKENNFHGTSEKLQKGFCLVENCERLKKVHIQRISGCEMVFLALHNLSSIFLM